MSDPDDSLDDVYGSEMRPHHRTTDLATLRARLAEVEAENEKLRLAKRPVAFRCKDYADGWIIFQDEARALEYQEKTGCVMQGLYARAALAQPKETEHD